MGVVVFAIGEFARQQLETSHLISSSSSSFMDDDLRYVKPPSLVAGLGHSIQSDYGRRQDICQKSSSDETTRWVLDDSGL